MNGFWLVSHIALWIVVLIQGIVLIALLRQIGLLHLRLQPIGARTTNVGPEIGETLPRTQVEDFFGRAIEIAEPGRPQLLLFIAPDCDVCGDLMLAMKAIARQEANRLGFVVLTSSEDKDLNTSYVNRHGLHNIPFVASSAVGGRFGVLGFPYAVLADERGIVRSKGIVNHIEHVESLIESLAAGHATEGRTLLWASAALAGGLSAFAPASISWSQRRAQVPAGWRGRFAPEVTSTLYGAILGVGILTSISFASFHVLLLWTLLSGDVRSGAVMFGVFGLARAAPPVLLSPFLSDRQSAFKLAEALMPLHDRVRRVTGLGLVALGATVLVQATR
jgi:methylamine dehydrogenase accessory protein MauD